MRIRKTSLTKAFIDAQPLAVVTTKDGTQKFFRHGRLHRDKGPAVISRNGSCEWWRDGKRHRDDGLPAIEHANGDRIWYVDGKRHRDIGPAVSCVNGAQVWYRDGVRLDPMSLETFDPVRVSRFRPRQP